MCDCKNRTRLRRQAYIRKHIPLRAEAKSRHPNRSGNDGIFEQLSGVSILLRSVWRNLTLHNYPHGRIEVLYHRSPKHDPCQHLYLSNNKDRLDCHIQNLFDNCRGILLQVDSSRRSVFFPSHLYLVLSILQGRDRRWSSRQSTTSRNCILLQSANNAYSIPLDRW